MHLAACAAPQIMRDIMVEVKGTIVAPPGPEARRRASRAKQQRGSAASHYGPMVITELVIIFVQFGF
jgi:hypothetical protein